MYSGREVYYMAFKHPNCRQSGLMEKIKGICAMVLNSYMKNPTREGKCRSAR